MFNINNFFKNGYDTFIIDEKLKSTLWEMIRQEKWEKPIFKMGVKSNIDDIISVPSWVNESMKELKEKYEKFFREEHTDQEKEKFILEMEFRHNNKLKSAVPPIYKRIFNKMIQDDRYSSSLKGGAYNIKIENILIWNGSIRNYWHWDREGNGDFFTLVYMTGEDDWKPEYGGGIQAGYQDLDDEGNWLQVKIKDEDVIDPVMVYPNDGTIFYCDNRNPRLIHKPNPLTSKAREEGKNRYSFLITYKLLIKTPEEY